MNTMSFLLTVLIMISCFPARAFLTQRIRRLQRQFFATHLHDKSQSANHIETEEYIFTSPVNIASPLWRKLLESRPGLQVVEVDNLHNVRWAAFRRGINIDSTELEPLFLGSKRMSDEETAEIWLKSIAKRISVVSSSLTQPQHYFDADEYQRELDVATSIISRASYAARSMQQRSGVRQNRLDKRDTSPVTVVDYGVQAVVLHQLHAAFPNDTFVAEEDSSYLRDKPKIVEEILDFVQVTLGTERWTADQLYRTIDLGASDDRKAKPARAWVLDPIDGTKGFIRGEHFCIALGLLDYQGNKDVNRRRPVLSVLGCPNLSLQRILSAASVSVPTTSEVPVESKISLPTITPLQQVPVPNSHSTTHHTDSKLQLFDSDRGCVFFAVDGLGAYVKSLDMAIGRGYPCTVSTVQTSSAMHLCESREAMAVYSRGITAGARRALDMTTDYVQLDGQCKHCLVGAGAVEGSLRLPPRGYVEKIWDHMPGCHFIQEAGGMATDLRGQYVDFSAGSTVGKSAKELSPDVQGVIVSNGLVHQRLVQAVDTSRRGLGLI